MAKTVLYGALAKSEQLLSWGDPPLSEVRNFLVLQYPSALGTAIHATPLMAALRAALPESHIVAAASGFALGALQGNAALDRLVRTPSPLVDFAGSVRALRAAKLFGGSPYVALQTLGNERTRIGFAAALSGGHRRVGFTVEAQLSSVALRFDPQQSQIANNLRLLEVLGHGDLLRSTLAGEPELLEPVVYPAREDGAHIEALFAENGIARDQPIAVLVSQTSPTQRKSWRPERFRSVAEHLSKTSGAQVVFAGTLSEAASIETLRAGLKVRTANLAGQTTLLQLAALFGLADVAVTLDTGPMHLARAMQTPTVIIAPAWSPPLEWLPVGNPRARILKNLDLASAPVDYVIDEVTTDEVNAAVKDLLSRYPPCTWAEKQQRMQREIRA